MTSSMRHHAPAHTHHSVPEGPGMSSIFSHLVFLKHTLTFLALWPLLERASPTHLRCVGGEMPGRLRALWISRALAGHPWEIRKGPMCSAAGPWTPSHRCSQPPDYDKAPSFTLTAVGGHPPVPASSCQLPAASQLLAEHQGSTLVWVTSRANVLLHMHTHEPPLSYPHPRERPKDWWETCRISLSQGESLPWPHVGPGEHL